MHDDEEDSTDAIQADHSGFTSSSSSSSTNCGKQVSGFIKSWLKGREHWLVFDRGMYCKLCIKHNLIETLGIKLHVQDAHQDSIKLEAAASTSVNISQVLQSPLVPAHGLEQAFSCLQNSE